MHILEFLVSCWREGIGSVTGQEGMFHAREGEIDKVWVMETGVD